MKIDKLKRLVEKWIQWSSEAQLKLFKKNKKTISIFKETINWSNIK